MNSDPKVRKEIGDRIRTAREKAKLTQAEVAKKAGINVSYYAFIERGEVDTSISKLEKISKAIGVKSSDILPF